MPEECIVMHQKLPSSGAGGVVEGRCRGQNWRWGRGGVGGGGRNETMRKEGECKNRISAAAMRHAIILLLDWKVP